MPTVIQPSFAKGEISPSLHGRVDTTMYAVGLETGRNVRVRKTGGAENRPGMKFVVPVADHSYAPRIYRFRFKTTDTYALEFGDRYMRVIRNDGLVLETAKDITGATQADPSRLTVVGHGWPVGTHVYVTEVLGMTELNGRHFKVANTSADNFDLVDQIFRTNVDSTDYGAYVSGGKVAKVYQIETPYTIEDAYTLKFTQSADVITITHPSYPPKELRRTDHDEWVLATPAFEPSIDAPTDLAAVASAPDATTYTYTVTAVKDTGEESLRGLNPTTKNITGATNANPVRMAAIGHDFSNDDEIYIDGITGMTELNGRRFQIGNKDADHFDLIGEDGTNYTPYAGAGTAQQTFIRITNGATTPDNDITWSPVAGAQKYVIYKQKDQGKFGLIGETVGTTFNDDNLAPDMSSSPPIQRNPFRLAGDYPAAVGFFEQRRVMGGSDNKPDTSHYSRTGNYSNFTISSPLQADDAITATLPAGQVNSIRHYVGGDDLMVFTSGSENRVNSGTDSAFAPDSIRQRQSSIWGCSHREPIRIGTKVLYVTDDDLSVRNFGYSLQIDNYTGNDLTLLAGHFFGEVENRSLITLVDWAHARSPGSLVAAVRSDGQVVLLTYEEEQEVLAWTRWDTDGLFERVTSIQPSATDKEDAFYFVVRRFINGKVVRFIERTWNRRFNNVKDCFFVDAGMSYDRPLAITDISAAGLVTAPAHGLSVAEEVEFDDIVWVPVPGAFGKRTQPEQLNGRRFTVATVPSANTFTVSGADFSDFTAYVRGGAARKIVTEVTGLHHLEGTSVTILADGSVMPAQVVSAGAISLPNGAARVHVGLGFVSDVGLLNIEVPQTTIQGKLKKVVAVTARVEKTREFLVGPDEDNLTEAKFRDTEAMGDPTRMLTGDHRIIVDSGWDSKGRLLFRQYRPLPFTLLAAIPEFVVED